MRSPCLFSRFLSCLSALPVMSSSRNSIALFLLQQSPWLWQGWQFAIKKGQCNTLLEGNANAGKKELWSYLVVSCHLTYAMKRLKSRPEWIWMHASIWWSETWKFSALTLLYVSCFSLCLLRSRSDHIRYCSSSSVWITSPLSSFQLLTFLCTLFSSLHGLTSGLWGSLHDFFFN